MTTASYVMNIDWNNDGDFGDSGEDVTEDLKSAYIERGFSSPLARVAQVGHGTITLDNQDRTYSPPLSSCVVPRRRIRFDMICNGASSVLFDGYVTRIAPVPGQYRSNTVVIEWSDALSILDTEEGTIAASTDVYPDDAIDAVVGAVYTPVSTCYDPGLNVIPVTADRWSYTEGMTLTSTPRETMKASDKIMDVCKADWGRFFIGKDGAATFANRHRTTVDETTDLTLDDDMVDMGYHKAIADIYNRVEVTCHPRVIGEVNEVLGKLEHSTAQELEASASQMFDIRFKDPANVAKEIGGKDIITPVAGTDYELTTDEAGGGADMSGCVTLALSSFGDRLQVKLTNTSASSLFLQSFRVRGIAIRSLEPVTVIAENASSISTYRQRKLRLDVPLMATRTQAKMLADWLLLLYKDPQDEIYNLTFDANSSSTLLNAARDLDLLDRVAVTETQTGLSAFGGYAYKVVHRIRTDKHHRVSLWLEDRYDYGASPFRIDVSDIGGSHVLMY